MNVANSLKGKGSTMEFDAGTPKTLHSENPAPGAKSSDNTSGFEFQSSRDHDEYLTLIPGRICSV
jgi:hypothetical protein